MMGIAAAVLLTPTRASAQFVITRGGGWGALGGYWGNPYSPISPAYNPAGFGAFGGYGYGNYLNPGYFPSTYGTNPFLGAAYGFPGLYNYGLGAYSGFATTTPVPGWPVGPATGYGGTGYAAPRMRQGSSGYSYTPAVATSQFVGAVSTAQASEPATIVMKLPDPDAEVWVEGSRTNQMGTIRHFVSPALTPGNDYVYAIRARWRDAQGAVQVQQQNVMVQAGAHVNVTFPTSP
jgi:uncharacterized protein (TIGR03000 family)